MRKNLYLIIISFSMVSCYTYQVKKPKPVDTAVNNPSGPNKNAAVANNPVKAESGNSQNMGSQPVPVPVNVQEKLAPNKNVKIQVDGKTYKVIVDKWENDSLVAHPVHHPEKILKFHKNQINAEKIAEKRFSQPIADIITVVAYAGIAASVWLLVR